MSKTFKSNNQIIWQKVYLWYKNEGKLSMMCYDMKWYSLCIWGRKQSKDQEDFKEEKIKEELHHAQKAPGT